MTGDVQLAQLSAFHGDVLDLVPLDEGLIDGLTDGVELEVFLISEELIWVGEDRVEEVILLDFVQDELSQTFELLGLREGLGGLTQLRVFRGDWVPVFIFLLLPLLLFKLSDKVLIVREVLVIQDRHCE